VNKLVAKKGKLDMSESSVNQDPGANVALIHLASQLRFRSYSFMSQSPNNLDSNRRLEHATTGKNDKIIL